MIDMNEDVKKLFIEELRNEYGFGLYESKLYLEKFLDALKCRPAKKADDSLSIVIKWLYESEESEKTIYKNAGIWKIRDKYVVKAMNPKTGYVQAYRFDTIDEAKMAIDEYCRRKTELDNL